MIESATYSVVLSGNIRAGFEPERVIDAFARLFKLTPEKAGSIVGTEFVVKREVDLQVAKTYKGKLVGIGVEVLLKRDGGIDELALEPVQPESSDEQGESAPPGTDEMLCPKCALKQPKAEECSGCGVIIQKFMQRAVEIESSTIASQRTESPTGEDESTEHVAQDDKASGLLSLIAPVVAAVLGALLWYLIAIKLEYEFGLIAWLIGGAIGFSALASGARGNAIGVICGLLALMSICGGKYMTVASQQTELAEFLSGPDAYEGIDLKAVYAEEVIDARKYVKLPDDDASLRHFMVTREYSEFTEASQVTDQEIGLFLEVTDPRLRKIALNRPSFEEWQQYSLSDSIEDLSTLDLMVDSLEWIDLLFLLFGVGTAFRLASQGKGA